MKQKKAIGKTIATIGKIALGIIEKMVISRIENDKLREGIKTLIQPVKGSLTVLSDNDPNDKEQIERVWLDFMRSQELANYTEAQVRELIDKVKIQAVRDGLDMIVLPTLRMFQALLNADTNNLKEIELIWLDYLRSPELREFLLKEVDKLIHKIQHEQLRRGLEILINPVINTLSALVDLDPNNKEQLENIWLSFIKSQQLSLFVFENIETLLSNIIDDEIIVQSIVIFLQGAIDSIKN